MSRRSAAGFASGDAERVSWGKDGERERGGKGRRERKVTQEVMPAAEGEVVSELPSGAQPRRMRGTAAGLVGCAGGASPRRGEARRAGARGAGGVGP